MAVSDKPTLNEDYVFDNAWRHAGARLTLLQAADDPGTIHHLTRLNSERGYAVTGLDSAPTAIACARASATARGSNVCFVLGDAHVLAQFGDQIDTLIDSGLFHVFFDYDRGRLASGLQANLVPGGLCHLLCFGERTTMPGPQHVRQAEIRARQSSRSSLRAWPSVESPGPNRGWRAYVGASEAPPVGA
jgi:hypothetical protein